MWVDLCVYCVFGIVCVTAVCAGMVIELVGLVLLSCWYVFDKVCVIAVVVCVLYVWLRVCDCFSVSVHVACRLVV